MKQLFPFTKSLYAYIIKGKRFSVISINTDFMARGSSYLRRCVLFVFDVFFLSSTLQRICVRNGKRLLFDTVIHIVNKCVLNYPYYHLSINLFLKIRQTPQLLIQIQILLQNLFKTNSDTDLNVEFVIDKGARVR